MGSRTPREEQPKAAKGAHAGKNLTRGRSARPMQMLAPITIAVRQVRYGTHRLPIRCLLGSRSCPGFKRDVTGDTKYAWRIGDDGRQGGRHHRNGYSGAARSAALGAIPYS